MGSAAWAKPLTIRRPPQGGAKRERLEAHVIQSSSPQSLQISLLLKNSPSPLASLMPPTPPKMDLAFIQKSSKFQTSKKMPFSPKMELFWLPVGTQKSQKSQKVPPKGTLFTPS